MEQQTTRIKEPTQLFLIIIMLLVSHVSSSQTFYTEDFETDGNGTRYFPELESFDGGNDYFMRTDNAGSIQITSANGGAGYSGASGVFYWAGEDHDDGGVGGSGNAELELEIRDINITGKTNLFFTALFGGYQFTTYENAADYVIVEYRIDNAAWLPGISFQPNASQLLSEDTNGDGVGDNPIFLDSNMQSYEFPIPETGTEIDFRVRAGSNSSGEEWAIDLIQLSENSTLSNTENIFTQNDIKVYSNAQGVFNVEIPNAIKLQAIEVFDLAGKRVHFIAVNKNSSINSIDLSSFQSSIYILKILTDKGIFNKKIIKQ